MVGVSANQQVFVIENEKVGRSFLVQEICLRVAY